MEDRDCKSCVYSSPSFDGDNGCIAWACEYIPREEAIAAWKEKQERRK